MKRVVAFAVIALVFSLYVQAALAQSLAVPMTNTKGEKIGEAKLRQTPHGVLIQADLSQLPPGTLAFHIHAVGKCEPPFESAGSHFNPTDKQHGLLDPRGQHAGDLPNVHVAENGTLKVEVLATQVAINEGQNRLRDTDGSALVIHAKPDDYHSNPAGNAGDRIACGVITQPTT
jgi:superoxide dismutase, Cu-Zn family